MGAIILRLSDDLRDKAMEIFHAERELLARLVPLADIQHVGGTAIPGCLTKGNVDINLRVPAAEFDRVKTLLQRRYTSAHTHLWTGKRAFFRGSQTAMLPVGVELTVRGAGADRYVADRDFLRGRPDLVAEINDLKTRFHDRPESDYRDAKEAFFNRLQSIAQKSAGGPVP